MDGLLWGIGVVMRFPFYVVGIVIVTVVGIPLTLLVGLWWVIVVPALWVLTIPFRLFNLPRRGATQALKQKLSDDVQGWGRTIGYWFSGFGDYYQGLQRFLLKPR